MKEFIKIPLTEEMKKDYKECDRLLNEEGKEKDCSTCSMNGGPLECLGGYRWCKEA